jgi:hypothetical protein
MKILKEELLELVSGSTSWMYVFNEHQITTGQYAGQWQYGFINPGTNLQVEYGLSPTHVPEGDFVVPNGSAPPQQSGTFQKIDSWFSDGSPDWVQSTSIII